ncbi:predicted protein [Phaeodactylum tricornutum CCAP 1055/1]|uniref:Polysaccharide pyruvyl transferase domain-containing protein n=1 Tax=Phaeodactylum tricornutum (strain CCAP 1055/1) TaxID=556484 RepID=B7GE34_PHATC|nr:predicted protein [Phaeodactylum tricornutum CCAP 1055/1]EEC43087.1 predicted protein [Phaeodactylum tricornutum CCAP 1055/1]|eukprot:XP_002185418.1 predicted protein [Phaeodactylum tricornutum CCAP 1055/1]
MVTKHISRVHTVPSRPQNSNWYRIPLVAATVCTVFSGFYSLRVLDCPFAGSSEAQLSTKWPAPSIIASKSSPSQATVTSDDNGCRPLANGGPVSLVWAYDDPPTLEAMKRTMEGLASALPGIQVAVYCGSSLCVTVAHKAVPKRSCIWIQHMVAPRLAQDSPLEDWVGDHVLAKLLSANHFEQTLQVVMQLVVIWKYGGMVLLPGSDVLNASDLGSLGQDDAVLLTADDQMLVKPGSGGGLYAVAAPPTNKVIEALMDEMLHVYQWPKYVASNWPVNIQWDVLCARMTICLDAQLSLLNMGITTETESVMERRPGRHFGTLSYQARRHSLKVVGDHNMNKGDEMQGLAGLQFRGIPGYLVERDRLDVVSVIASKNFSATGEVTVHSPSQSALTPTTVFLNAWWGDGNWIWPPPGKLEPVFVSMHLNNNKIKQDVNKSKAYLNQHWPIGARDTESQRFLKSIGVHSVFSGCMTMTLLPTWSKWRASKEQNNEVLIVDVNKNGLQLLPDHITLGAVKLSANLVNKSVIDDQVARYFLANEMKLRLQKAKLVITQRLHIALPAASMGTPVILIMDHNMPGGGGVDGARFSGLQDAVHTVNTVNGSEALASFNWDQPPPNPNPAFLEVKRNALQVLTMCHGELTDSARKFGVIPTSWEYPPEADVCRATKEDHYDNDAIHIATAINPMWLHSKPILSSWIHALYKSNPREQFVFYFLADNMNAKQRCIVRWMVLRWFPNAKVYTIPLDQAHVGIPKMFREHAAKLLLPRVLPCVGKALWIDSDAIILKSLRPMWSTSKVIPNCGIVARNSAKKTSIGALMTALNATTPSQLLKKDSLDIPIFDTAVMVLDLGKLRRSRFIETVASYWSFTLGGDVQISMNMQCNGTHGKLDSAWNMFLDDSEDSVFTINDISEWRIVHFQGQQKPWVDKTNSLQRKIWSKHALSLFDALYGPVPTRKLNVNT